MRFADKNGRRVVASPFETSEVGIATFDQAFDFEREIVWQATDADFIFGHDCHKTRAGDEREALFAHEGEENISTGDFDEEGALGDAREFDKILFCEDETGHVVFLVREEFEIPGGDRVVFVDF